MQNKFLDCTFMQLALKVKKLETSSVLKQKRLQFNNIMRKLTLLGVGYQNNNLVGNGPHKN